MKSVLKLYKKYRKNTKQAVYLCIELIDDILSSKKTKIGYSDPIVFKENSKLIIVANYF